MADQLGRRNPDRTGSNLISNVAWRAWHAGDKMNISSSTVIVHKERFAIANIGFIPSRCYQFGKKEAISSFSSSEWKKLAYLCRQSDEGVLGPGCDEAVSYR